MGWTLLFYQTPAGERPVAVFVEQLPEPARAAAAALLDGIVRKRDDIPSAVLKRLRQLQREVLASGT